MHPKPCTGWKYLGAFPRRCHEAIKTRMQKQICQRLPSIISLYTPLEWTPSWPPHIPPQDAVPSVHPVVVTSHANHAADARSSPSVPPCSTAALRRFTHGRGHVRRPAGRWKDGTGLFLSSSVTRGGLKSPTHGRKGEKQGGSRHNTMPPHHRLRPFSGAFMHAQYVTLRRVCTKNSAARRWIPLFSKREAATSEGLD